MHHIPFKISIVKKGAFFFKLDMSIFSRKKQFKTGDHFFDEEYILHADDQTRALSHMQSTKHKESVRLLFESEATKISSNDKPVTLTLNGYGEYFKDPQILLPIIENSWKFVT